MATTIKVPYRQLGRRIRDYRLSLGITQEELAAIAQVSRRHIQSLEYGQLAQCDYFVMLKIQNYLGLSGSDRHIF